MSSIVRWEPFSDLVSLRDAMDRLFEESFVGPRAWLAPAGTAAVAVDMYETENDVVITVPVPGVKAEDMEITVTGDVVTIKGDTKWETKVEKANYYRQERRYGSFARRLALPVPVQADKAEAKFKDGVLTLTLPKADEVKPKSIKVQSESK